MITEENEPEAIEEEAPKPKWVWPFQCYVGHNLKTDTVYRTGDGVVRCATCRAIRDAEVREKPWVPDDYGQRVALPRKKKKDPNAGTEPPVSIR